MVAVYLKSPLDFAAFPAVLLITTLFRLSISISTTRLILLNADAWFNEHLLSVHVTDRTDLTAPVIRSDGARRAVPDRQALVAHLARALGAGSTAA